MKRDPVLEPWRWQEINSLNGYGIVCVDQAADGTLWFGAAGGLIKYSGSDADWYPFSEELIAAAKLTDQRGHWCAAIHCMPDGSVLALIESSLVHWKNGDWTVIATDLGITLYESRIDVAPDGGFLLLNKNALRHCSEDLSSLEVIISAGVGEELKSYCLDLDGNVWVVLENPSNHAVLIHIPVQSGRFVDQQFWTYYPVDAEYRGGESSICCGLDGTIWYVTNDARHGIRALNPKTGNWSLLDHPEKSRGYYRLMRDHRGTLWAGGVGELLSIEGQAGTHYPADSLDLPKVPFFIFEADDGRWWLISRGGFVHTMNPRKEKWQTYGNLHFQCETPTGIRWFIVGNQRAVSYDPKDQQWLEYTLQDGVIDMVRSIYCSRDGLIWAVGEHQQRFAFSIYDGKKWERHRYPDFARFGEGVLEAADGTMWFGATGPKLLTTGKSGGALQFEVKDGHARLLKHHMFQGFPVRIPCLAQTPDGSIWLGSPGLNKYIYNDENPQVFSSGLSGTYTDDLEVGANGRLWVAKGLFGIYKEDNNGWIRYIENGNLKGNLFVDLLGLNDGTLLAASDKGISRFDGEVWAETPFDRKFGMPSRGGNMRQSRDGAIWLNYRSLNLHSSYTATAENIAGGYCSIRYVDDGGPPETWIGKHPNKVDSAGNIHISWGGIDSGSDTPPDRLYYSWRLDGGEWPPFSQETGQTFTGLKSGRHTFEVRARDWDFNIDATPATTHFRVALPLWRQGWFIAMSLSIVFGSAAFIGLMIWFHDKRLKDRAAHAEEIDRLKTSFFTNISHEINTPLHVVSGSLERLMAPGKDEDRERLLSMAKRNVERMTTLISQLLDFRKLEQGVMSIQPKEGDITEHMENTVEMLQPLAKKRSLELTFECKAPCCGWFDPDKMEKISTNLIGNAIKYTPSEGYVRVVMECFGDREGEEMLSLVVEDSGRGIAPEYLKDIFERFYRTPEKSIVDGSGIGLNLTKELVDLWGGEIYAESPIHDNPHRPGSRFVVHLPIGRENINGFAE